MPDPTIPRIVGEAFVLRSWRADGLESWLRHADDEAVWRGLRHRFPDPDTRLRSP